MRISQKAMLLVTSVVVVTSLVVLMNLKVPDCKYQVGQVFDNPEIDAKIKLIDKDIDQCYYKFVSKYGTDTIDEDELEIGFIK